MSLRPTRAPANPLPRYLPAGGAVALGTLLLVSTFVWSALTEVEIVVTAPAAARPAAGTAELRSPDTRSVAQVEVEEGQPVGRGELIVVLDPELLDAQWQAAVQTLQARRKTLAESRQVAHALENDTSAARVTSVGAQLRIVEHRSRLAQLDDEIRALAAEVDAARQRQASSRRLLDISSDRYHAARVAARHGALSRFDLLAVGRDLLTQRAELDGVLGQIGVLEKRLSAQQSARRGLAAGHRQSVLDAVAALEVEVAELVVRLAEVETQRRHGHVTAPIAGVVDQLLVAPGDFVQRGETLAVIVPAEAAVVFETRIAPSQAAFLRAGQGCRIKLDALPFARYGALRCTVELLGRDVVASENGGRHYLAKVRPAAQIVVVDGQPVRLQPGATGWVDIIAGRRTVLSFMTEPLTRFTRESLRER